MTEKSDPNFWMNIAIEESLSALSTNDFPIGAVLVLGDKFIKGRNTRNTDGDKNAHAEMNVLKQASDLRNMNDSIMYVTLEPCIMCTKALQDFGVKNVFYAVEDPINGGSRSGTNIQFNKMDCIGYFIIVMSWLKDRSDKYPAHFEYFSKRYGA